MADHPVFGTDVTVYPAQGQVQQKYVLVADPSQKVGAFHAEVVCIANFGPSKLVDGGGDDDSDIWEMRIRITKADDPAFEGLCGSLLFQDNGDADYGDESFVGSLLLSPQCGQATFFQMEPMLTGSLKVNN